MLTSTTLKIKHEYVVLLNFIQSFCNKYVDVIWCCTYNFGSPLNITYQNRNDSLHTAEYNLLFLFDTDWRAVDILRSLHILQFLARIQFLSISLKLEFHGRNVGSFRCISIVTTEAYLSIFRKQNYCTYTLHNSSLWFRPHSNNDIFIPTMNTIKLNKPVWEQGASTRARNYSHMTAVGICSDCSECLLSCLSSQHLQTQLWKLKDFPDNLSDCYLFFIMLRNFVQRSLYHGQSIIVPVIIYVYTEAKEFQY
jgi:hypothetical protein